MSLATKYRPKTFSDVTEQGAIKVILEQQIKDGTTQHAYLFCGGAGTGKTTCARIFANEINKHLGVPFEVDAASNNSVDDVRSIIQQAKTQSLDSEYKIFILDEVHMLSTGAWNALLKVLEEPPAKAIFIMCTTDPQKIPKTILSRVQRYDFQRISQVGIVDRLKTILGNEFEYPFVDSDALDYIAKVADGGMRDAITLLDKCLAYSTDLTLDNVVRALGSAEFESMQKLVSDFVKGDTGAVINSIDTVHSQGKDIKRYTRDLLGFVLDIQLYYVFGNLEKTKKIPNTQEYREWIKTLDQYATDVYTLMSLLIKLNADMKWDNNPRELLEATLILDIAER